jgi:BASS family bile acid:Na+ symporter
MKKIFNKLSNSYFIVISLAFLSGVMASEYLEKFSSFSTFFLGAIFFLSALKINLKEVTEYLSDKKMIFFANLFMLILLPILVYYTTLLVFPALAVAFLLLAAMPSGMTDPLLSEISGGKQSLALVLTVSTSLLAPFTIPFVIEFFAGQYVSVGFFDMFEVLAVVIFIPFFLAEFVKYFFRKKVQEISGSFKQISIIFLGLLIAGIVAKQAGVIKESLFFGSYLHFSYLTALFIFFIVLHIVGYFAISWRKKEERVSTTICLTYMNFTLAIYLADKFFTDPNIVVPVILSIIPWVILFIPFKFFIKKFKFV